MENINSSNEVGRTQPNSNSIQSQYTIQNWDSLSKIAKQHKTSIATLARLNNISDPNKIIAGRKLLIPTAQDTKQEALVEKVHAMWAIEKNERILETAHISIGTEPAFWMWGNLKFNDASLNSAPQFSQSLDKLMQAPDQSPKPQHFKMDASGQLVPQN